MHAHKYIHTYTEHCAVQRWMDDRVDSWMDGFVPNRCDACTTALAEAVPECSHIQNPNIFAYEVSRVSPTLTPKTNARVATGSAISIAPNVIRLRTCTQCSRFPNDFQSEQGLGCAMKCRLTSRRVHHKCSVIFVLHIRHVGMLEWTISIDEFIDIRRSLYRWQQRQSPHAWTIEFNWKRNPVQTNHWMARIS